MRFTDLTAALQANLRDDRHLLLIDGEGSEQRLSFAELYALALDRLGALRARGLPRGAPVILYLGDNRAFLEAFWACVLGGCVPVPIAVGASDEHRRKLYRVFAQCDQAWVLSDARTLERLAGFAAGQGLDAEHARLAARAWPVETLEGGQRPGTPVAVAPDDIAFIQYSSGSTSDPKGVVLTHRNLTANIASIIEAARFCDRDVALSWMPLTHDMGLIGFHLNMLACGATHAIMRTDLFARRPLLWLAKASQLRATVLCSPNFGYEHYLRQYALRGASDLDLSGVRLIFNGAEPISADLCRRFMRTMAPHGLPPDSMFTVYGLAEASLAVSFPRPGAPLATLHLDRSAFRVGEPVRAVAAGHPQASEFVRLGRAVPGTELRIVDEAGAVLPDRHLGHVRIRGENVTRGYYRDAAATARAIDAQRWLDTGDLGFLADGELVITGRARDIIFIHGQNYYPHDLEALATQVPGIEINKVVAAGLRLPGGVGEELGFFILHRGDPETLAPLARQLRALINPQAGLEVARVIPVPRIPKTTSGKLQRHALVRAFEQRAFDAALSLDADVPVAVQAVPPPRADTTLARLQQICAEVIPDRAIGPDTNLLEINLNSLTLARLHEAIDQAWPERLEIADFFERPSLQALAACLDGGARR